MKFKPTIPLKRNKKEVSVSAVDDALNSKQFSNERGRGRGGRGRGRGRGRGLIIEEATASGIFSLGPSIINRGRGGYSGGGGGFSGYGGDVNQREEGDSTHSDMVEMFTNTIQNDTPVTFKHVSRLAGDVDPVTLSQPSKTVPWMRVKSNKEEKSTETVHIKAEPGLDTESTVDDMDTKNEKVIYMDGDAPAQNIFALDQNEQLLCVAEEELLHFQLPTVIPRFEAIKADEVKEEVEDVDKMNEDETKALEESMKQLDLSELPEGQIGKLIVYKSGKMKLKVGSILLDIQQGTQSTFLENIMVVDHESEESKKVIELGHIVQKYVCAPNMDALLQEEEASLI
ncbi:RNA polymerase III RPC4-domain-containing protein [Pilobolus umbonatus]|nr:RNA polymerase III RPC4-domain-containing protein [Pilobolus umbonatus]